MRGIATGQVRNYFPSYRVFIYGVEVTKLCTSVRTNWPTHSPMQCTVELVNPDQLMTLTQEDAAILAGMREMKNSQLQDLYRRELDINERYTAMGQTPDVNTGAFAELSAQRNAAALERVRFFNEQIGITFRTALPTPPVNAELANIKNTVIPKKLGKGRYFMSVKGPDDNKLPPELFFKYPFYQGKWIWHFSDPISVVFRDPVDPSIWYWAHRGTVTDISEKETEDKQSVLTITSEGVLKALRSARIMSATGAILSPQIEGMSDDQFFSLLTSVPYTNFLQNLTLRNIVEVMTFGTGHILEDIDQRMQSGAMTNAELQERYGGPIPEGAKRTDRVTDAQLEYFKSSLRNLNTTGIDFKRWRGDQGVEVRILGGPIDATDAATGAASSLHEWQRLIDNRVRVSDLGAMLGQKAVPVGTNKRQFVSTSNREEQVIGNAAVRAGKDLDNAITEICSDFEKYPINQRVRMLLPAHLGSRLQRDIVDRNLASNISSNAEFFDRLSIMQQTLEPIEFVLYDTPRGDIIVEMPLYDFEPHHFTKDGRDYLRAEGAITNALEYAKAATVAAIGQTASNLTFARIENDAALESLRSEQDQNYAMDFVISKFEQVSIDISSSEQDVKTAFVAQPRMMKAVADDGSRTGKRGEYAVLPNLIPLYGLRVEQGGTFNAITSPAAARVYAQIMLNRTNADTVNIRVPCLPNWAAWPNRPILVESRNFLATTKTVSHSISWQSDANTDYGLWHCKFWDGRTINDEGVSRNLYVPFGGVNARPFNYAYLLGIKDRAADVGKAATNTATALLSTYNKSGRR